ncbi:MAG: hypothetical protein WAW39_02510 [Prosthecobacter sp.]|uniref:hypothetical protein n=1 Tax=Prosthecobacter sp. TaxID=1965333 RepID=UPI003BAF9A94
MHHSSTAFVARFIGLGICLFSTWISAWGTLVILAGVSNAGLRDVPPQPPDWEAIVAFALLGLSAWSITSLGEWFWSFEEGWFRLQRALRLIQCTLILGGIACAITFRIAHEFHPL